MSRRIGRLGPGRVLVAGLALLALGAGGYGLAQADVDGWASADPDTPSPGVAGSTTLAAARAHTGVPAACASTVLGVLGDIAARVYHEGVSSERTAAASAFVERSLPLREAVERDDPRAARAAAKALLATGHLTSLRVTVSGTGSGSSPGSGFGSHSGTDSGSGAGSRPGSGSGAGERVLVNAGTRSGLAPLYGTIVGSGGAPIAKFTTSVWTDNGFISELEGIDQGQASLRAHGHNLSGSFALPAGHAGEPSARQGTIAAGGVVYDYISLPVSAYPDGQPQRVYVLRAPASIAPLCASTGEGTLVNTIGRVAKLIYTSEAGPHALVEVRRVQRNQALLQAVAAREPEATRLAIDKLLNQHIVRMRVSADGELLSDVGGPYVLAPVRAPLRLHGRRVGTVVLSIQDDEGYKRLAQRLAGVDVLMYMQPSPASGSGAVGEGGKMQLVKDSLGPLPSGARVPASGSYTYHGHTYRVLTLHAEAFPSGPLRIVVLIPIPYR